MEFTINLGQRSYPVILDSDIASTLPSIVTERFGNRKFACITNTTIAKIYKQTIDKWNSSLDLSVFTINDGERYKTIDTWQQIINFLIENRFERSSCVIALGGGVVGDISGFAAASFLRGISYIQVPTTLLAMVDSSIGGKTAVDHPMGKNLIGAFHQPSMTIVDTSFLKTLPYREFVSGYAELYKYGFIGGNDVFNFVKNEHAAMLKQDRDSLLEGIRRSIEIKGRVVEQDEFETKGTRALLNFGHTFAHSIERFFDFDGVLHGEAVMWGIRCACALSKQLGLLPSNLHPVFDDMIDQLPVPPLPSKPDPQKLYQFMFTDKKVSSGKLRFIVPINPGESIVKNDIPEKDVIAVLNKIFC